MATPPEQPWSGTWSNYEKNYLLAEIIKVANPPPSVLLNVIQNSQLQPHWEDTPLPPGRSLNSCRHAFEELRRSIPMSMTTALTPAPVLGPTSTLKRPFPYETTYAGVVSGREIRPKPPATSSAHAQPSPTDPPVKKKRGRPTKAEALAKAEAAAATVATYGEPSPVSVQRGPPQTTPQLGLAPQPTARGAPAPRAEGPKMGLAPAPAFASVTRMPIAAMLTPTAGEPQSGSHSQTGSSSGRRRRAKSAKSEPGESPTQQTANPRHSYESPYAAGRPADPSAAVLRHHEDSTSVPPNQPMHEATHDRRTTHDSEQS